MVLSVVRTPHMDINLLSGLKVFRKREASDKLQLTEGVECSFTVHTVTSISLPYACETWTKKG